MQNNATSASKLAGKPFIENWIQSLTRSAGDLTAQRIKPMIDVINNLGKIDPEVDSLKTADKLWDFCTTEGLVGLLNFLPTQQPEWLFDPDDIFVYVRRNCEPVTTQDAFRNAIGAQPAELAMTARVTSGDWTNIVRNEALRQRKSMNVTVFPDGNNLELASTAKWDGKHWQIAFEQIDWVTVNYEDPFRTKRPRLESMLESILWCAANANDSIVPKQVAKLTQPAIVDDWFDCVPRLKSLHQQVLIDDADNFAPWFRRTWRIVWPVVYRELNMLRGMIELEHARMEIAACITAVPRLTLWMFVYAKLISVAQVGRGLGPLGDFVD